MTPRFPKPLSALPLTVLSILLFFASLLPGEAFAQTAAVFENPPEELAAFSTTGILRWTAVPTAERFEVRIYSDSRFTALVVASGSVTTTSYRVNLTPATTYFVRLWTRVGGVWVYSESQLTTTSQILVAQITNTPEELAAFSLTGTLRWDGVAGATGYNIRVYSSVDHSGGSLVLDSGTLQTLSYQLGNLTAGVTYYVQLSTQLNGTWRAVNASLTAVAQVLVARLSNSDDELAAFSPNGNFRWYFVPAATAYELRIYSLPSFSQGSLVLASGSLTNTNYRVSGLTPGANYYVRLWTKSGGVWRYTEAKITVANPVLVARFSNQEQHLLAFGSSGELRWDPVPGATAYRLEIFTSPGYLSPSWLDSGEITATSYGVSGLTPATNYYLRLWTKVSGIWRSADAFLTTAAVPTTAWISSSSAVLSAFPTTNGTLQWNAIPGAEAYEIRVYGNSSYTALVEASGRIQGTSYQINATLTGATTYYVQLWTRVGGVWRATAINLVTAVPVPVSGLDSRPSNTTCLAPTRPQPASSVALSRVFPNLTFSSPIHFMQPPNDSTRWYVVLQDGVIRTFANSQSATSSSVFIDISGRVASPADGVGGEMGLLGMAFHPDWPSTPEVFLSYTRTSPQRQSVISRFTSTDGGATLSTTSEQVLLTVNQPEDNHNGGNLMFGPDGMLYLGLGDGGGANDTHGTIGNSQDVKTLLGKFIRINVNGTGATYTIPADNPNATNAKCTTGSGSVACPEIWAMGLRNPWRWSFDRATGDIWVGDVGQDKWEEVDRIVKGGNYGWRFREGKRCNTYWSATCPAPGTFANGSLVIDPVVEYCHAGVFGCSDQTNTGQAVTGGYVYRGTAIPALAGLYIFADDSGPIWSHIPGSSGNQLTKIVSSSLIIPSFAEGNDGELYVLSYTDGKIYKLVPGSGTSIDTIPDNLADTGCVDSTDPTRPAAGLIPYKPNAPFWSDGAVKERYLALPNGQSITVGADNDWDFPNGTVLMKNFRIANKLIETRLFMKHPDGIWGGYTYEWNDAETGATRVIGGKSKVIGSQTWVYPSEQQCLQCHTSAAGRSLGLETPQQNGDFLYPSTGRTANQVVTLNTIGAILPAISGTPATLPAFRDPYGTAGTLNERARAWLHTNCSQCHRPGGPTPVNLDFRYTTALSATNACNVAPSAGTLGLGSGARIIQTGNPSLSVLITRIQSTDSIRMPPLGSKVVDAAGAQLLQDWISQLESCTP
jgi:uncharacterized repeat protein (TIGR03806 family)